MIVIINKEAGAKKSHRLAVPPILKNSRIVQILAKWISPAVRSAYVCINDPYPLISKMMSRCKTKGGK